MKLRELLEKLDSNMIVTVEDTNGNSIKGDAGTFLESKLFSRLSLEGNVLSIKTEEYAEYELRIFIEF